jgi:hypothetical protein
MIGLGSGLYGTQPLYDKGDILEEKHDRPERRQQGADGWKQGPRRRGHGRDNWQCNEGHREGKHRDIRRQERRRWGNKLLVILAGQ